MMKSPHLLRRQQYSTNAFVVLSDVMIVMVLILLLYFTALVIGLQRKIVENQRTVRITEQEELRVQKRNLYQAEVESILRHPRLRTLHQRGQLSAYAEGDVQVFTFGERILFQTGRYNLSQSGEQLVATFGSVLGTKLDTNRKRFGTYPEIQVQGHTDTTLADNWTLSMQRALAVVKVFSRLNAPRRAYLSAAGYSCHRPWAKPRVGEDQPRNRRIEVRLIYSQKFVGGKPFDCNCDL